MLRGNATDQQVTEVLALIPAGFTSLAGFVRWTARLEEVAEKLGGDAKCDHWG
jgi:hypothetical protein